MVVVVPVRLPSPASSTGTGSLSSDSDANPRAQEGKAKANAKAKAKAEAKVVAVPVRPPWSASSDGSGRLSIEEAVTASGDAASDAVAAADAAAQQLVDDEAAAPRGKGKAKEWVRLIRRLLSLPNHGQEMSSGHIRTILDAQDQRDSEGLELKVLEAELETLDRQSEQRELAMWAALEEELFGGDVRWPGMIDVVWPGLAKAGASSASRLPSSGLGPSSNGPRPATTSAAPAAAPAVMIITIISIIRIYH